MEGRQGRADAAPRVSPRTGLAQNTISCPAVAAVMPDNALFARLAFSNVQLCDVW